MAMSTPRKAAADGGYKKGMVTNVDSERRVCKVQTDTNQTIPGVRVIEQFGSAALPSEGDRVLILQIGSDHIIIGKLPPLVENPIETPRITMQSASAPNVANYQAVQMGSAVASSSAPVDMQVGDNVMSTNGGGQMGVLRGGTAVMKASPTAQLILSRFGDLARLVSRNYEHFTDVDSTYKVNARGSLYVINEVYRNQGDSRAQRASFKEVIGNVPEANGPGGGKGYARASPMTMASRAADDGSIFTQTIYDEANDPTSVIAKKLTGETDTMISKGGRFSHNNLTTEQAFFNVNGTLRKATEDSYILDVGGGVTLVMEKGGLVTLKCQDVKVQSSSVDWNASGEFKVTAGGAITLKGSTINLN